MHITTNVIRWIAAATMAVGLGAAAAIGGAVASADPGSTTVGPTDEASTQGTAEGDAQSKRRRATFSGASVTEVKLADVDANENRK